MTNQTKKVLITGGAGFIGSHLVDRLIGEGYPVTVIDINIGNNLKRETDLVRYKANINDSSIEKIFRRSVPEIIFHLAGPISLRQPIMSQEFTVCLGFLDGLMNLLNAALKYGTKKVILISSGGAIYGDAGKIPTPEGYHPQPNGLYGLANLMMENLLQQFCSQNRMGWQILRLGNLFGPRQWQDGIIPRIVISLLSGTAPVINGDGRQTRDFLYISDAIDALVIAMDKDINGLFNLGSGIEIPINIVLNELIELINVNISPIYRSNEKTGPQRSCLDSSKFRNEFGWQPETCMEKGLLKTISWYRENY